MHTGAQSIDVKGKQDSGKRPTCGHAGHGIGVRGEGNTRSLYIIPIVLMPGKILRRFSLTGTVPCPHRWFDLLGPAPLVARARAHVLSPECQGEGMRIKTETRAGHRFIPLLAYWVKETQLRRY